MLPKLECTTKYELFELHEINRSQKEHRELLASMKKHGFMPSGAIQVTCMPNGKLRIIRGHHRFAYAKRLGLPVYYIVDNSNVDLYALEGGRRQSWSIEDFADSRAADGDQHCQLLLAFRQKHGVSLRIAASLIGGETAGSGNKAEQVRSGSFKAGDLTHAYDVVEITDFCRAYGLRCATRSAFVAAISRCVRVPELNRERLKKQLAQHGSTLRNCSTTKDWLEELERIYNYQAPQKSRVSISFRANQIARERQKNFGQAPQAASSLRANAHRILTSKVH